MYPLNASSGPNETSLDPHLNGETNNMPQQDWLNGSFYFPGLANSYILVNHNGSLDLMHSFTITAWIFPVGNSGKLIVYEEGVALYHETKSLVGILLFKDKHYKKQQLKLLGLEISSWNFVGFSYNFLTGYAKLFIGSGSVNMSRKVGNRKLLATDGSIKIGSSFKGGISHVLFYDVYLNDSMIAQIMKYSLHFGKLFFFLIKLFLIVTISVFRFKHLQYGESSVAVIALEFVHAKRRLTVMKQYLLLN